MSEDISSALAVRIQRVSKYFPSEARTIATYILARGIGPECHDHDLLAAVKAWEASEHCRHWRRRKMEDDGSRQIKEIELHKYFLSKRRGFDVGWDFAAFDWIEHHARAWREWWEMQPESSPALGSLS